MKTQDIIEREATVQGGTAASAAPARGPRDHREQAFVTALTASTTTDLERKITLAGQLFLLGAAGFVVVAAVGATLLG